MSEHEDGGRVLSLAEKRAEIEQARARAEADRREQDRQRGPESKPWLTYSLMGAIILVWLAMVGVGVDPLEPDAQALLDWGGNVGVRTVNGEWWRLLTATFLHAGIMHLAFNAYFLWAIGRITERVFGPAAYALVYFGSGLIASMVSVAWQPAVVGVGASGALFGVFGAFLGFTIRRRDLLPEEFVRNVRRNALILIGLNLAIGLFVPNIDLAAHLGGLVAGLGIGYLIARLAEKPVKDRAEGLALRRRVVAVVAAMVVGVLVAGALLVPRYDDVYGALDRVFVLNSEAFAAYNASAGSDDAARIEALEAEVIPKMRELEAELAALERVPPDFEARVEALRRYAEMSREGFELELRGRRQNNPLDIAKGQRLVEEADGELLDLEAPE